MPAAEEILIYWVYARRIGGDQERNSGVGGQCGRVGGFVWEGTIRAGTRYGL